MKHDGPNEQEVQATSLGRKEKTKVSGNELADLLEMSLVAAEHARQQYNIAREYAGGDVSGGEDGKKANNDHEDAQAQVNHSRVEDHFRYRTAKKKKHDMLTERRRISAGRVTHGSPSRAVLL